MKDGLQVKFAAAFLEEIFQTLPEQVHNHYVVHFPILSFLISYEVKEGNECLASELVDKLALPEQHDVALHFNSFFLQTMLNLTSLQGRVPAN